MRPRPFDLWSQGMAGRGPSRVCIARRPFPWRQADAGALGRIGRTFRSAARASVSGIHLPPAIRAVRSIVADSRQRGGSADGASVGKFARRIGTDLRAGICVAVSPNATQA